MNICSHIFTYMCKNIFTRWTFLYVWARTSSRTSNRTLSPTTATVFWDSPVDLCPVKLPVWKQTSVSPAFDLWPFHVTSLLFINAALTRHLDLIRHVSQNAVFFWEETNPGGPRVLRQQADAQSLPLMDRPDRLAAVDLAGHLQPFVPSDFTVVGQLTGQRGRVLTFWPRISDNWGTKKETFVRISLRFDLKSQISGHSSPLTFSNDEFHHSSQTLPLDGPGASVPAPVLEVHLLQTGRLVQGTLIGRWGGEKGGGQTIGGKFGEKRGRLQFLPQGRGGGESRGEDAGQVDRRPHGGVHPGVVGGGVDNALMWGEKSLSESGSAAARSWRSWFLRSLTFDWQVGRDATFSALVAQHTGPGSRQLHRHLLHDHGVFVWRADTRRGIWLVV